MSILFRQGDIFDDDSLSFVNPVNCVGVMGKGLALRFRQDFPENYRYYKHVCEQKMLIPGRILPFIEKGRIIFNFPTKYHWLDSSKYE